MNCPRVWAEVDISAIAHNVRELRRITQPQAKLMAVVKANAYGHGLVEVAEEALKNGAQALGIAEVSEGIALRKAGIAVPILILGYTPPDFVRELIQYDLIQTVYSFEIALSLSDAALLHGKKLKIHIKVDTGMGRLGILIDPLRPFPQITNALKEIESIAKLKGISIEGIFTHFALSDYFDKTYTKKQFEYFINLLDLLNGVGISPRVRHAANSAALIDLPETHLDMVRPGISLYGLYPSGEVKKNRINLKPAMSLKAKIIHLKKVPAGFNISYGATYKTQKPTMIATVPCGYADGVNRLLSSRGHMLVHGCRVPIVGRVCMDLTMIDVGKISNVEIGDEVVIFGSQNDESITVEEIASSLNTINYEIVSTITNRVPRIYV